MKYLETLKAWLSKEDILYHETPINILWKNTLRDIQKDVEGFWQEGGWMSLLNPGSDEEEEG
jgi:nucleosome binding factor SPN SPT16 subunit